MATGEAADVVVFLKGIETDGTGVAGRLEQILGSDTMDMVVLIIIVMVLILAREMVG